mmetsp:Transcript_52733/g.140697  ORF Transcript_52733/g.140697 Transcript_52733/m.140697 type:complete len:322 (+) Transcript_52733:685-1650(+)
MLKRLTPLLKMRFLLLSLTWMVLNWTSSLARQLPLLFGAMQRPTQVHLVHPWLLHWSFLRKMSTAVLTVGPLLLSVILVVMRPSIVRKWRVLLIVGCCVTEKSEQAQQVLLLLQRQHIMKMMSTAVLTVGPLVLWVILVVMRLSIVLKWKMPPPVLRVCLLQLVSVVKRWRPVVLVLKRSTRRAIQTRLRLQVQLKAPCHTPMETSRSCLEQRLTWILALALVCHSYLRGELSKVKVAWLWPLHLLILHVSNSIGCACRNALKKRCALCPWILLRLQPRPRHLRAAMAILWLVTWDRSCATQRKWSLMRTVWKSTLTNSLL